MLQTTCLKCEEDLHALPLWNDDWLCSINVFDGSYEVRKHPGGP